MPNILGLVAVVLATLVICVGAAYVVVFHAGDAGLVNKIGVIGSAASGAGILITLYQVFQTKRLVVATKEASEATAREMRNKQYRHSLVTAKRLLQEIKLSVDGKQWRVAAIRADDLAIHASELTYARPRRDDDWANALRACLLWADIFRRGKTNAAIEGFEAERWSATCADLHDKLSREYEPFL